MYVYAYGKRNSVHVRQCIVVKQSVSQYVGMNNLSIDSSALFYNSLIKTNRKQYQHNTVSLEMKQRRLVHSCGQIGNMYTRMVGCGGAGAIVEAAGHEVERGVGPVSPSLAPGAHDR